jgi:hypothetical protein
MSVRSALLMLAAVIALALLPGSATAATCSK